MRIGGPPKPRIITDKQVAACPEGAKIIPLTRGWVAWVDNDLYETLASRTWYAMISGNDRAYAARRGAELMHRTITRAPSGMDVDHREWPGMVVDNRRENLREATRRDNLRAGRKRSAPTSSRYKGVCFSRNRWVAGINLGKRKHLGCFPTELEAALAYDAAARHHFGEFARLNLPDFSAHLSLKTLIANGRSREASQPWGG